MPMFRFRARCKARNARDRGGRPTDLGAPPPDLALAPASPDFCRLFRPSYIGQPSGGNAVSVHCRAKNGCRLFLRTSFAQPNPRVPNQASGRLAPRLVGGLVSQWGRPRRSRPTHARPPMLPLLHIPIRVGEALEYSNVASQRGSCGGTLDPAVAT